MLMASAAMPPTAAPTAAAASAANLEASINFLKTNRLMGLAPKSVLEEEEDVEVEMDLIGESETNVDCRYS